MAQTILCRMEKQTGLYCYSLMVDEKTYWVREDLTVNDIFFGFYQTDRIDTKVLVQLIKDIQICKLKFKVL